MHMEPLNQTGVEIDQKHQTVKIRKSISKMLQEPEEWRGFCLGICLFVCLRVFNLFFGFGLFVCLGFFFGLFSCVPS